MEDQVVQELYSTDGKRRLLIYRRGNGTFYYESHYFSEHEHEMCWVSDPHPTIGIYADPGTALIEAQGNLDWLIPQAEQGSA